MDQISQTNTNSIEQLVFALTAYITNTTRTNLTTKSMCKSLMTLCEVNAEAEHLCNDGGADIKAVVDQCRSSIFEDWYTVFIGRIYRPMYSRKIRYMKDWVFMQASDTAEFCIFDRFLMLRPEDTTRVEEPYPRVKRPRKAPSGSDEHVIANHTVRLSKSSLQDKSRLTFRVAKADRWLSHEILTRLIPPDSQAVMALFATRHKNDLMITRLRDTYVQQAGERLDYNHSFHVVDSFPL